MKEKMEIRSRQLLSGDGDLVKTTAAEVLKELRRERDSRRSAILWKLLEASLIALVSFRAGCLWQSL